MTTNRFRTVALALRPYVSGAYDLLEAADAVVAQDSTIEQAVVKSPDGHATYDFATKRWLFDHEYSVERALASYAVGVELRNGKKINAIKELRAFIPGIGLADAKRAVEDDRVSAHHVQLYADPWAVVPDRDEPPF